MFELLESDETIDFADKRLSQRYEQIRKLLDDGQSCIINKISTSRSERKGSYDFFRNNRVEEKVLKSKVYE